MFGINCDTSYDGQHLLEKLDERSTNKCEVHKFYKLIIIDNNMPFKTGVEVAHEIKEMSKY